MRYVGIHKKWKFLRFIAGAGLLFMQIGISSAFGQCPESSNFIYDYISINKGGETADWSNPSIWKSSFWVKPNNPPSFGKVKHSIAINGNVILHNKGFSIEFNQLSKVCGNLTVEGKLIVSGGCSPLNVHGKLIVHGDLETSQAILVWPGAEVVVYGDWIIKGGVNPIIMGNMAVKGDVDSKFGVNVTRGGLFITFGSYSSKNGLGLTDDDFVVNGDINIPSWSFKLGIGDIYCLGSSSRIIGYKVLNKVDLQKNLKLYTEFIKYQNLFWPIPSKYIDLNVISDKYLQEYHTTGCVTDSVTSYKTSVRNRIYLDSKAKNKSVILKFNGLDKKELRMTLDDSLWVDAVSYSLNGESKVLDKQFFEKSKRFITIYLNGRAVNDVKISGLQGIQKVNGQNIILENIRKEEIKSLSVYSIADLTKPVFTAAECNSWNGTDQSGKELNSGVYFLRIDLKNGTSIAGQFLIK